MYDIPWQRSSIVSSTDHVEFVKSVVTTQMNSQRTANARPKRWRAPIWIAVMMLALAPIISQASGSYSSGGGANQYNLGKRVVHKKLICDSCPLAGQKLNASNAGEIVSQVSGGEFATILTAQEQEAAVIYLKRRYKL